MPKATFSALYPASMTASRMRAKEAMLMPSPWMTPAPVTTLNPFPLVVHPKTFSAALRAMSTAVTGSPLSGRSTMKPPAATFSLAMEGSTSPKALA